MSLDETITAKCVFSHVEAVWRCSNYALRMSKRGKVINNKLQG